MKDAIIYLNTVLLVLAIASGAFFVLKSKAPSDEAISPRPEAGRPEDRSADRAAMESLGRRLDGIEAILSGMSGPAKQAQAAGLQGASPGAPDADSGETPVEAGNPAAAPRDPAAATSRPVEDVREIVREVLRQEEERKKKETEEGKEEKGKQKKTISEVSQELGLSMDQEQKLRDLHRDMSNELMKVLFEVPDDEGLPQLKAKLKEAEYNPETRAQLAEKLVYNWTMSQNKVTAVVLKAWTRTSVFLSQDQIKALDKYDLQQEKPEWPDLEKMFFNKGDQKPAEDAK